MARIICIDGVPGAGKSTTARIIRDQMGGEIIGGRGLWAMAQQSDFFNKFGFDLNENLNKNDIESTAQFVIRTAESNKMGKLEKFFDEKIRQAIENSTADPIIIEFNGLSKSIWWERAYLRIAMDFDEQERIAHITNKGVKPKDISYETAKKLGDVLRDTAENGRRTADIVVFNDYGAGLTRAVTAICDVLKQKIVCITGPRGSGKSTAAPIFAKLLGAKILDKKEIKTAIINTGFDVSKAIDKKMFDQFTRSTNNIAFAEKFARCVKTANADIIIVDNFFVSKYFQWNTAHARVYIDTNPKKRMEMFTKRQISRGIAVDVKNEAQADKSLAGVYKNAKNGADYVIFNDYDTEFEQKIARVCGEIKAKQLP